AKAGIHLLPIGVVVSSHLKIDNMDSRFRGNDETARSTQCLSVIRMSPSFARGSDDCASAAAPLKTSTLAILLGSSAFIAARSDATPSIMTRPVNGCFRLTVVSGA